MTFGETIGLIVHWLADTYNQLMTHPKVVTTTATVAQTAPAAAGAGMLNNIWGWVISGLGFFLILSQLYYSHRNGKFTREEAARQRELYKQTQEIRAIESKNSELHQQKLQLEIEALKNGRP